MSKKAPILAGSLLFAGGVMANDVTSTSSCVADAASQGWRLAQRELIVDTHIDVPYRLQEDYEDVTVATQRGNFDQPRAACGGLDVVFMSIYIPPEKADEGKAKALADELIDSVEDIAERAPDRFALVRSTDDVESNFRRGKISMPMGMENGSGIEGDLANLKYFYDRGIRYITLAHSKSNDIADSSYDQARPNGGLSDFGRRVVKEMNRLGIMVDVSHISDAAFEDVMEVTGAPPIASHSSARHFTPGFERNMSDDMIRELAARGGVIQINFGSPFLTAEANKWFADMMAARGAYLEKNGLADDSPEAEAFTKDYGREHPMPYADLSDVLDHIDHVVQLVGVEHVGVGSDFDGVGDSLPVGLKDVSDYPNLVDGLLARGFTPDQIRLILGGNLMRVWRAVEAHAARY